MFVIVMWCNVLDHVIQEGPARVGPMPDGRGALIGEAAVY